MAIARDHARLHGVDIPLKDYDAINALARVAYGLMPAPADWTKNAAWDKAEREDRTLSVELAVEVLRELRERVKARRP